MVSVSAITQLQMDTVALWHNSPIENNYSDLLQVVCEQHRFNFLLWHEEDIARSPDVTDTEIAKVKRNIDRYNQQRNDAIEKIDDYLISDLASQDIVASPHAKQNTETPGSTIDRLSILALRLFHMEEQIQRSDASSDHIRRCQDKLTILQAQHSDLSSSLQELLNDIYAGQKRLKVYRQFKMYNDPTLNPYLYQRKAG